MKFLFVLAFLKTNGKINLNGREKIYKTNNSYMHGILKNDGYIL